MMRVAFQHVGVDSPPIGESVAGPDRVYIGERFCLNYFTKNLARFGECARACGASCWLTTPAPVRERDLSQLCEMIMHVADQFEGVLVGDVGLGGLLAGRARLSFWGDVMNRDAAKALVEYLGVELIRPYAFVLPVIESLVDVVNVEAFVYGRLPLAATPRCLVSAYAECGQCDVWRRVDGGPSSLMIRGNAVYTKEPLDGLLLVKRLQATGVAWALVEGAGCGRDELAEAVSVLRRQALPANVSVSACFMSSKLPWYRRLDGPKARD